MKDVDHEEKNLLLAEADMHKQESLCSQKQNELDNVQKELDTFKSEKKKIENNNTIQKRIDDYEAECKVVDQKLKDATEELTSILLSINSLNTKRIEHSNALVELFNQQTKYDIYKMYAEAVHRDGVPHELISNTIPQIQDEINAILEQLVDFRVILVADEKNINAYIAYDNDRYWPIELTSGMEKFVAGLAIRSSLINISSLPRPNFIAIDEGFGALDSNNLGSIVSYFDHLKNQFKFIMIISHIDSMRDAVDHHIEINKIDGRSNVQHVS
jgi:exonuclease SbcC